MTMDAKTPLARRYMDEAVSCRLRSPQGRRRLRVASSLLTCELAAALMNEVRLPPESDHSYRHVNMHNPRRALRYDEGHGGWLAQPSFERHPVWGLNWDAAQLLCRQLGARLPWAAEWEAFAAGGEPGAAYPWGDEPPSPQLANYDEHFAGTTPVGCFAPNALGVYDLAGNLAEWCLDVPTGGPSLERVVKGGAWSKGASQLRIDCSRAKWARLGTTTIGLRPVWEDGAP
jgi:formylglycine-generating enzyme required for sulfatase activity